MSEHGDESSSHVAVSALVAVASPVIGASIALAAGGTGSDVLAAGVGATVEQIVSAYRKVRDQRVDQAERAVVLALDEELTIEALARRMQESPALLHLVGDAVEVAATTAVESKIATMGRAIRTGALAQDDARVDEERLVVRALRDLEAPHIRLLYRIIWSPDVPRGEGTFIARGSTREELANDLDFGHAALDSCLRTLESAACIRRSGPSRRGDAPDTERWSLTLFGMDCYNRLVGKPSTDGHPHEPGETE